MMKTNNFRLNPSKLWGDIRRGTALVLAVGAVVTFVGCSKKNEHVSTDTASPYAYVTAGDVETEIPAYTTEGEVNVTPQVSILTPEMCNLDTLTVILVNETENAKKINDVAKLLFEKMGVSVKLFNSTEEFRESGSMFEGNNDRFFAISINDKINFDEGMVVLTDATERENIKSDPLAIMLQDELGNYGLPVDEIRCGAYSVQYGIRVSTKLHTSIPTEIYDSQIKCITIAPGKNYIDDLGEREINSFAAAIVGAIARTSALPTYEANKNIWYMIEFGDTLSELYETYPSLKGKLNDSLDSHGILQIGGVYKVGELTGYKKPFDNPYVTSDSSYFSCEYETIKVKSGDTLSEIAEITGISMSELMRTNGISNPNYIQIGQNLKYAIPGTTIWSSDLLYVRSNRALEQAKKEAPTKNK